MFPHYSYPLKVILGLARDALLGRRRDFGADARACIAALRPPLFVKGAECIPSDRPCVITVNHYYRPGFRAQWIALAVSAAAPRSLHWVMTGEWTFPGKWFGPVGRPASRLVLSLVARAYGFTSMPPMPPRPGEVERRAAAVRRVLRHIRQTRNPLVGLAPEGSDAPDGKVFIPAPGLGRFCLLLSATGLLLVPAGIFEAEGQLHLTFGSPYQLSGRAAQANADRDRLAAQTVMSRIADLLPPDLRGEFNGRSNVSTFER